MFTVQRPTSNGPHLPPTHSYGAASNPLPSPLLCPHWRADARPSLLVGEKGPLLCPHWRADARPSLPVGEKGPRLCPHLQFFSRREKWGEEGQPQLITPILHHSIPPCSLLPAPSS